MKLRTSILWAAMAVVMLAAGCKSEGYDDGTTPLSNAAFIDAAEISPNASVVIKKDLPYYDRTFSVKLVSPAPGITKIDFTVDESALATYNHRHGTSYGVLPQEYYELVAQSVSIEAGKIASEPVTIHFKGLETMELDKNYLLPVSLTGTSSDIDLLKGSETVWFMVKRSSAITTAADLSDGYMWIPSYENAQGWAALQGFKSLTYEAIINLKDFTHTTASGMGISVSSVMGIEEHCLMRIGDASYPRQQIQMKVGPTYWPANSRDFVVSSISLQPGEWYHVAFTWDIEAAVAKLYVNGRLAYEAPLSWEEDTFNLNRLTNGGADDKGRRFFIGYSYDPDRPLYGLISEARVWSVARSQEDIFRDMYEIKEPETKEELRGYWKFDEGHGNEVVDHSKYGNNAFCLEGKNNFETGGRKEGALRWNTNVEIPILNREE